MTTTAMDNTVSTMFPDEPPRLSYHSNHENDTFVTSSPILCLGDNVKFLPIQPHGSEIYKIITVMQNHTIRFRDQDLISLSGSATGNPEIDLESSLAVDCGRTVPGRRKECEALQTSDPILKAISIVADTYAGALISHAPFHDYRNQAVVKELHSILVTTGIDGLWSYMPGVLSLVLTVGVATAMTLAWKDLFYKQVTQLHMFIKVKLWQDLRVGVMNFVWIAQTVLRLNRMGYQELVAG
jgi:hypothetical protein